MPLNKDAALVELTERLRERLVELKEDESLKLAQSLLDKGADHNLIKESLKPALSEIGRLYDCDQYYASSLVLVARILKKILVLIHPAPLIEPFPGRVLLLSLSKDNHGNSNKDNHGNNHGNNHGKDRLVLALASLGFEVRERGLNPNPTAILAEAKTFRPNLVGLLLGPQVEETSLHLVKRLKRSGSSDNGPFVFLFGPPTKQSLQKQSGADGYLASMIDALELYHRLILDYPKNPWRW
ncbi:MAG: B12-binding domain-containing protein [Deltaproteobacteria bacterium]|jgi:5-methyltetrahydrofolate--homocysteine methyltransferase|nr:B12-binding domain-containing protein [Deltaproteobacteria bacterium]